MDRKSDFVERVLDWNHKAGRPSVGFNVRDVALHTGLQLEELAEKIGAIAMGFPIGLERSDLLEWAKDMDHLGGKFKSGEFDSGVAKANRLDLLDGDVDIMVVTIGAMMTSGATVQGALHAVADANDAKFPNGVVLKDGNGKIQKPQGWEPANLWPFVANPDWP